METHRQDGVGWMREPFGDPGWMRVTPKASSRYSVCVLTLWISTDYRRVLVAGGEIDPISGAREADRAEIESLAERFGTPELQQVVAGFGT